MKCLAWNLVLILSFVLVAGLRADLIHHWELEDDFSDSVSDADGAPVGFPDFTVDAKIGEWALVVNGFGDYVDVFDRDSLRFTAADSYTVAAWVNAAAGTSGWRGIVTKGRDAPPWYGIWINPQNEWTYGVSGSNALTGPTYVADEWTHIAILQNGIAGTRELYVNGFLVGTEIARDAFNSSNLAFGGALSVDEWFVGAIDDVRVYDEPLDAGQIAALAAGEGTFAERTLELAVSGAECPPAGRGPVRVVISRPLGAGESPDEEIAVVERLRGPVGAASVTVQDGGVETDVFPDPVAPIGMFADHRNIVTDPDCPGGNGDTVEDLPGTYTQTNVGEDIWQDGDTLQFAYNKVAGDFDVTTRVADRTPAVGSRWGKHGIMARQDISSRSRYTYTHDAVGDVDAFTGENQNNDDSTRHAWRPTHGGNDNDEVTPYPSNPSGDGVDDYCDGLGPDNGTCEVVHDDYLRLARVSSVFTSYSRGDPADPWTVLGSHDWGRNAPAEVLLGLATTSHSTDCSSMISVTFDGVDYGGANIVPVVFEPIGVDITWNITRQQLADGIEYTLDIEQGQIAMTGTADGETIFGSGGVSLQCDTEITNLLCEKNDAGGADLNWENHPFADPAVPIQIEVNRMESTTVPGDATSATLSADMLPETFNEICVVNSSGTPVCCGLFVADPTPVHHWPLDDDFTDSVSDADGMPAGAAVLTDDARIGGGSLAVDGLGSHVEVLDRDSLRFSQTQSYTVAAWVKPGEDPVPGWKGVVTKGRDFPPWYGIWIGAQGFTQVWVYGTEASNALTGPPAVPGEWTHVAIVQDGITGTRALYLDGLLEGTEIARDAFNTGNLLMGGAASVDEWFIGQIDDVRIYDAPLGEDQIAKLASGEVDDRPRFVRGDTDADGTRNITDGVRVFNFLFTGGEAPPCRDAADTSDQGVVNITSGIYILNFLFLGGPEPPPPFPDCGPDTTPDNVPGGDLGCETSPACQPQ